MLKRLKSIRDWLSALEAIGDLNRVTMEVDWNLEMGAVTRHSMDLRAPAPLFERIAGIEPGFRALGAPGGLSALPGKTYARLALALGLPANAGGRELVSALADARARSPIPPILVDAAGAPCKQNILTGADVDLMRLPTPLIHGHDGGRYLQTYGINIVRTPDESWTNWSINRMMMLDHNRLGCLIPPNQHLGIIHAKWRAIGLPTPIAIAFGVEPATPLVGGMPIPEGMDEAAFLGGYFGEPLELVPAETVPIDVPATAEIVLEGHVSHTETAMEGPMDEFPGYVGAGRSAKPVLTVTAMTFRNDPILPFSVAGAPVEENHTCWGLPHAAEVLHLLRSAGLPVSMCWTVLESANHLMLVALRPDWHEATGLESPEIGKRIGELIFASKAGFGLPKLLLVEDDFDVTDVAQVMWAFTSRAHPSHGEIYFPDEAVNALPVFLSKSEKAVFKTTKVLHNALLADRFDAADRPIRSDLEHGWPADVRAKVLGRWHSYGYQG
ncbi:UbiD family decarboxylase [Bradyrhizobium sp. STM 3809]|uniref:UbiD family decarboxylase n=1 Tax=Bradyrhizobium sp. STM 3809 TaxID=551936 RepID=UPI0002407081|nr:UbiD family decarboxylase [Bradyrhizobium sp. STM 3809]CCD97728.1 putative 3-polyprenyl-4-hydroxybenzoate decarboxylase [Bradyrhizobium sp. STM 3809]